MQLYEIIKYLGTNRYPIKVKISATGVELPMVTLMITNQTSEIPVHIYSVRVHFGTKDFSRALTLMPAEKVTLGPKEKSSWVLSYDTAILTERTIQKSSPRPGDSNDQPGLESAAQLFNAIGMSEAADSWVEVDFNEYTERKFLNGKIKGTFDMVGKMHRESRNLKQSENGW